MFGIRRIRSVMAAQKVKATKGSRASWPPAFSHLSVGAGWSVKQMPSNPESSAVRVKRVTASLLMSSGLLGWLIKG